MTQNLLRSALEQHNKWLITTHKGPDGDAVGSVVAWAAYAKQLSKDYLILFPDQPAAYLCPFLEGYEWAVFFGRQSLQRRFTFCFRLQRSFSAWRANGRLV